jgi:hypothetical protein
VLTQAGTRGLSQAVRTSNEIHGLLRMNQNATGTRGLLRMNQNLIGTSGFSNMIQNRFVIRSPGSFRFFMCEFFRCGFVKFKNIFDERVFFKHFIN